MQSTERDSIFLSFPSSLPVGLQHGLLVLYWHKEGSWEVAHFRANSLLMAASCGQSAGGTAPGSLSQEKELNWPWASKYPSPGPHCRPCGAWGWHRGLPVQGGDRSYEFTAQEPPWVGCRFSVPRLFLLALTRLSEILPSFLTVAQALLLPPR